MQSYYKIGDEPLEWKGKKLSETDSQKKSLSNEEQVEHLTWPLSIEFVLCSVLSIPTTRNLTFTQLKR
jgi:hypothetical protein